MINFRVIEPSDAYWTEIIRQCKQYDFYHTRSYYLLGAKKNSYLFIVSKDRDFIAMPLVVRKIDNTEFYDCTSAYGYCGPVSNLLLNEVPESLIQYFFEKMIAFFKENKIITAFSRLHPIYDQRLVFSGIGTVREVNKTVFIDLTKAPEEQKRQYRKSNKSEINQLRKKGFEVREATTEADLNSFISMYYEAMKRVNASEDYFFSSEYFRNFMKSNCFKTKLLLAVKDDNIAAGAIFTFTNEMVQYHLAATNIDFIKAAPMKLIIDEARLLSNNLRMKYLHLGGGVAGRDDDSLFKFKAGFSDLRSNFSVWQYIVDEDKYNDVNRLYKVNIEKHHNYFPLYRTPNLS